MATPEKFFQTMAFDKWPLLYSALLLLVSSIGNIAAQSCGGTYTTNYGVFMSPNYPNVYNNSCECIYTISLQNTSSITLSFETYELDRSSEDYISISCGSNSSYVQKTYDWNDNIPPVSIPWCSSGRLYFYSDSSHTYTTRGFRVQYQVSTKACDKTVFTSSSGTISSPNYPQNYNNNENCTYSIWAAATSSFTLSFQAFRLESDCQRDWVQIRCDNSSYILPKYCGSTVPKPAYITKCNKVLIWFHTSNSNVYSGFSLQYSVTPYGCGKLNYAGLSGVISSPNYPKGYNRITCDYYLYPVSSIALAFQSFDLDPFIDSSYGDYVRINCYSNSGDDYLYYRGNTLPPLISYTLCSSVRIYFYAYYDSSGTGFSIKYQVNPLVPYSKITNAPKNYAINVGSRLQLDCTSNAAGYLPSWTLSRDGTEENTTVIATFCVVNSGYTSKYSVVKGGSGVCNLVVVSPTMVHAGVYTCIDVGLASSSSVVTVMDVDYTETKQSQVVKGDLLTFKLSIQFNGSVAPAPILPMFYYWNITGNSVAISSTTLPNIIISSINVTAEPEVVPSHRFTLTVSAPTIRTGYATNAPTYSYSIYTTSYIVQYWPEESNMAITGHYDGYIAYNGVLQCNVSSNPLSSYRWLDQSNGFYTNGHSIVVTNSGTYICNASNVIRSKTYWSSKSITVDILNTTSTFSDQGQTDSNVTVIVLAVFLAICALGNIGVAIFCILRRRRKSSREEDHQHTIQGIQERSVNDSVKTQATGSVYEDLPIRVLSPESSRKTDTNGEVFYEHLNHGFDNPTVYENLQRQ